jgi:capsular polysaccharide export protein
MSGDDGGAWQLQELPTQLHVYGFPRWKWPVVRQCFPGRRVVFLSKGSALPPIECLVLWGMAPVPAEVVATVRILRMEDGFLRSVGLGADLVRPLSWVVDERGLYYDATRPSDLERILVSHVFDSEILARAAALREKIVDAGLTKYNVGFRPWNRPPGADQVILVPGQVESDASITYGVQGKFSNMDLLRAVRATNPEAYVVYKPHPDVLARMRIAGQDEGNAARWCDEVVVDANMGDLLQEVDEVHVLTSLAGFEALLRGKVVHCYGQPFYSGWGLTRDQVPNMRRQRRLSLDELVAGVLFAYPLYLSRDGRRLITPEEALDILISWRERRGSKEPWWQEIYRFVLRRIMVVH